MFTAKQVLVAGSCSLLFAGLLNWPNALLQTLLSHNEAANKPALAHLSVDFLSTAPVPNLLPELMPEPQRQTEIALEETAHGGLLVPVGFAKNPTVKFLLDTGASYTMLSPKLAQELGLETLKAKRTIAIVTANGKVNVPLLQVPELRLGKALLKNVEVLIQPLDSRLGFEGLLGMNALNRAEWQLEKEKLVLNY
jgi:clan AA aspartic protease (TIGR02281 family)